MEIYVYPSAGHGFGCDARGSYDAAAYAKAQERSLSFLRRTLA
jgi:carboxymethylenebutenolidase